jgi:DNA-binding Xre family transcriptional regulator
MELQTLESGASIAGGSEDQKARLNQAYDHILKGRRLSARNIVTVVFRWVLCSQRALTSKELIEAVIISRECTPALATSNEEGERISTNEISKLCSNFILLRDDSSYVQFFHHSVKEYLLDSRYCNDDYVPKTCHTFIAEVCLWYVHRQTAVSEILGPYIHEAALFHYSGAGSDNRRQPGQLRDLLLSFCKKPSQTLDATKIDLNACAGGYFLIRSKHHKLKNCIEHVAQAFIAACLFNLENILRPALLREAPDLARRQLLKRQGLELACRYDYYDVAKQLLDERKPAEVTVKSVQTAVGNSSRRVISLLLQNCGGHIDITPDMTKRAARNNRFGVEVMKALKDHYGKLPADQSTCQEVMRNSMGNTEDSKVMLELILDGADPIFTDETVAFAAGNRDGGEFISILLRHQGHLLITQNVLLTVGYNVSNGHWVIKTLLEHAKDVQQVSEQVLRTYASNQNTSRIFKYLFETFGEKINIT